MHILIVEDNAVKARRVSDLISSSPFGSFSIEVANDVVQAKKAMLKLHFDAMILDLQLPVRTGGPLMKIGGRFLLEEILASDLYLRPRYILGVSEYPDAISLSEGVFSENLFGLLDSSRPENEWIPRLESFINHAASATQVRLNPRNPSGYSTDLVIICALHVPELEGLLKLSYDWSEVTGTSCNPTFQATIRNASGEHKIVAVSALEMGMPAAAALAAKTIERFRPRYVAMTGIAGGVKGSGGFGDVVVADSCWDYSGGKVKEIDGVIQIENEPRTAEVDATLKSQMSRLVNDSGFLAKVMAEYVGTLPETRLNAKIGPIFTGTHVITSELRTKELSLMNRKLSAIDMEGYAIFAGARYAEHPRPIPLLLKGLSDFADKDKDDRWRAYASYTSARLLFGWAEKHL